MKYIVTLSLALTLNLSLCAQVQSLPEIYLNENVSTHFVSKLNIDYTDLSTNNVVGDLPLKNILRIKPKRASNNLGFVTIVGESFFIQFKLLYSTDIDLVHKRVDLDNPESYAGSGTSVKGMSPLADGYKNPNYTLSHADLERYALQLKGEKPSLNNVVSKEHRIKLKLNNIWVVDDYIFFDYTAHNSANIPYTIDEIRYKVIDAKKVSATSSQDVAMSPDYSSNKKDFEDKKLRNIVAFKKFTYPEDKAFIIQISEDQYSGRQITLQISYSDILEAKTFQTNDQKTK